MDNIRDKFSKKNDMVIPLPRGLDIVVAPSDTLPKHSPAYNEEGSSLVVYYNGEPVLEKSDLMEPDEIDFNKGLSWVADMIKLAYEIGYNDAFQNSVDTINARVDMILRSEFMAMSSPPRKRKPKKTNSTGKNGDINNKVVNNAKQGESDEKQES